MFIRTLRQPIDIVGKQQRADEELSDREAASLMRVPGAAIDAAFGGVGARYHDPLGDRAHATRDLLREIERIYLGLSAERRREVLHPRHVAAWLAERRPAAVWFPERDDEARRSAMATCRNST